MPKVSKVSMPRDRRVVDANQECNSEPKVEAKEIKGGYKCSRCGTWYPRQKSNFSSSRSPLYRGNDWYLTICNKCLDEMFELYRSKLGDERSAVRRICMKTDIYWNKEIFSSLFSGRSSSSRMLSYISRANMSQHINKTYDTTLEEEVRIANSGSSSDIDRYNEDSDDGTVGILDYKTEIIEITEDVARYWGSGFNADMLAELEERRRYWLSQYPEGTVLDPGEEAILRQICNIEIQINHDRATGRNIDKSVNALNTLLGSMNIKPSQKKDDGSDDTLEKPLGVWLYRYEHKRPLPDVEDDNKLKKYIFTWMGHVCKMLGIKNTYQKLYNEEVGRLSVQKPEFDGDEEELLIESYSENSDITPSSVGGDDG